MKHLTVQSSQVSCYSSLLTSHFSQHPLAHLGGKKCIKNFRQKTCKKEIACETYA
jgi:hypothetical protein